MPGQGTKVLNAVRCSQTKNLKAINDLKNKNKAWRLSGSLRAQRPLLCTSAHGIEGTQTGRHD